MPVHAGARLRLLVVAASEFECSGVDLDTGALVRAWSPEAPEDRIRPFGVVEIVCDGELDMVPDPAQPEALGVSGPPVVVDRMTGRRAERLIRALLHPQ